jgi:RHS repeat-associated protein
VLVTGLLDEFSTTYVNPDGTLTTDSYGSAIRVRDDRTTSGWRELDYDLVFQADGSVSPKSGLFSLFISGGGTASQVLTSGVVRVTSSDGSLLGFSWLGALPKPVLVGPKATYSEVLPGVDLVIEATPSGFEQFFVLNVKPSADVLASLVLPLKTKKVSVVENSDGSFSFENSANDEVASLPTPRVWDSSFEPKSGSAVVGELDANLNVASNTLELGGLAAFLDNTDLVYPVIVDPALTLNPLSDVYVRDDSSTSFWSSNELLVGTYDGGTTRARSYLRFRNTQWAGKQITAATLKIYETWSYSCNSRSVYLYPVVKKAVGSWSWSNQPTISTSVSDSVSTAKGYSSSCSAGWVSINAKDVTSYLASRTDVEGSISTFALRASETDSYGWKRFTSANGTNKPSLSVTYNNIPTQPSIVSVSPSQYVNGVQYVTSLMPKFTVLGSDGDKDPLTYYLGLYADATATTPYQALCSVYVSDPGPGWCAPTYYMSDNTTYYVRAFARDSRVASTPEVSSPISELMVIRTANTVPSAPTISCPGFGNGSNSSTIPAASVNCVVNVSKPAGSRPAANLLVSVNSVAPVTIPTSAGVLSYNVSLPPGHRGHTIQATSVSVEGLKSSETTFSVSFGEAGIYSPATVTKTSSTVKVSAFVKPSWIPLSEASIEWSTVDGSIQGTKHIALGQLQTFGGLQGLFDYQWNAREVFEKPGVTELADGGAVAISAKVCFSFQALGMSEVKCSPSDISLLVVPHAFNSVNPTASAGSGTVALLTGELQLSVSDASQSLPEGALSISRQYLSYDGPQISSQAVFGQGWRASFSGIDSGAATLSVADTTATQRLITLSDSDGETLVYKVPSGLSGISPTGTYLPADPSTLEAQATLSVVGATSKTLQLVEADGRKTVWNEATSNGKTLWLLHTITEATGRLTNSYTYDSNLRVTRILGPAPSGVSCNYNSENAGCKALYISYATATNTVTGDFAGQVKSIDFKAYDPSTSSMQRKTVATYKYDVAGYLTSVTDPRSNITTNYSYTVNALTQVKLLTAISQSTGLAGTYFMYDSQARLLHVSLDKADGSTRKDVVSTFVYNYQNGQNILPANTANLWDQTVYPKNVAAVFGSNASAEISEATENLTSITSSSLKFGTYYFSNGDGVTVNTATFGKSAWRYTYTKFDEQYRPLAVFDENAIEQIINLNSQGLLNNYNIYRFATVNKYAPAVKVGETQVDGGQLIESWEPTKPVQVGNSVVEMRLHTIINYNENEPTPLLGPGLNIHYGLETSRDITIADAESSNWNATTSNTGETFVAKTVFQYDPINTSLPRLHETSGWIQQQPTITQNLDEDGIVVSETKKVFDSHGRTLKTINSPTSNDLLTETTTYYTATANTTIPSCGLKPAWSGLVCVTGSSDGLGRQKPDQQITAYDYYLRPTAVVDTIKYVSGANTFTGSKTTNTSYISTGAAFGSVATTQTKSKNGTAAEVSGTLSTTNYDTLTGLVISKTVGSSTISYTYDDWGRKLTLTNKPDPVTTDTTTWSYMPAGLIGAGQVSSVTSTKSSYFYGYGGQGETSNQPTSLNVSGVGTYTAIYNNSGQLQEQTAPVGISQKFEYDTAGRIKTMSYLGTVDNAGVSVTVNWMDFTRSYDAQNRVAIETTPGVFPGLQNDTIYNYGYDAKSRLTNVEQVDNLTCVNRKYVFDASGNRLSKTSKLKASTGSVCDPNSTDELTEVESLTYNNYSQLTNTGYVYDVFGRATTVPSLHTANQAGNVTFAYSPEDRILSQTQGSTKTDYTYDALGRRYQDKVGSIVKTVRHYTDETDNPSWVTGTGTAAAQTDIFTTALASSLNATRKVNGTTTTTYLNVGNLHGDTITSLQLPSTGYVAGPNELNVFDEYGVQQTLNPEDRPEGVSSQTNPSTLFILNYGSLGQPQRETTDTGIQFMGARGYNPITGQFLSPDPIQGGNETPYNYPNDPINVNDLSGKLGLLASLLIDGFVNTLFVGAAAATCFGFPICLFLLGLAATEVAARASNNIESYLDSLKSSPRAKRKHVLPEEITNAESWTFSQTFESLSKTSKKYKRLRSFATKFDFLRKMGARGSRIFDYSLRLARIADDYIYSSGKVNFFSEWIY